MGSSFPCLGPHVQGETPRNAENARPDREFLEACALQNSPAFVAHFQEVSARDADWTLRLAPSLLWALSLERSGVMARLGDPLHRRHLPALPRALSPRAPRRPRPPPLRARAQPHHHRRLTPAGRPPLDGRVRAHPRACTNSVSLRRRRVLDILAPAHPARVAKLADAPDLGSGGLNRPWGFDSPLSHQSGDPMKVDVESLEGCKRRMAVEAPVDVVQKEWERAYGRVQKQARLPGVRKGHVPRSLVKVHFADDVRREVAQHLIPDVYRQALTEARLEPVDEPDLQDVRLEEGAPLSFVAVVEVKPVITLGEYNGLDIQHAPRPVTSPEVETTIDQMREQQAQFVSVDRAANPGDLVILDYTMTVEGQEPVQQTGYSFIVGDHSVMPEIDQAVAGMRAGEERTVSVRFSDDHRQEAMRGKPATATVKVAEVKEKVLPELNDDLARSLGQFETLEALRAEVLKQLEARWAAEDRHGLEDRVVDALAARQQFAVPESLILRQVSHQVEHARERLRRQGVNPDAIQWDYAKLLEELRPAAERTVRRALLLEAVAEREGIAPSEADLESEVDRIARAGRRPTAAIRRMMEKSGDLDALRSGLRERMTLDFLIAHANVHE